jgi:hypothetical protein
MWDIAAKSVFWNLFSISYCFEFYEYSLHCGSHFWLPFSWTRRDLRMTCGIPDRLSISPNDSETNSGSSSETYFTDHVCLVSDHIHCVGSRIGDFYSDEDVSFCRAAKIWAMSWLQFVSDSETMAKFTVWDLFLILPIVGHRSSWVSFFWSFCADRVPEMCWVCPRKSPVVSSQLLTWFVYMKRICSEICLHFICWATHTWPPLTDKTCCRIDSSWSCRCNFRRSRVAHCKDTAFLQFTGILNIGRRIQAAGHLPDMFSIRIASAPVWNGNFGMSFKNLCWHRDFVLRKCPTSIRNSSEKPKLFLRPLKIS